MQECAAALSGPVDAYTGGKTVHIDASFLWHKKRLECRHDVADETQREDNRAVGGLGLALCCPLGPQKAVGVCARQARLHICRLCSRHSNVREGNWLMRRKAI